MAKLTTIHKRFIVQALACWDTPTQVVRALKDEFGVEVVRQHVSRYDPTKVTGQEMSKDLKAFFYESREQFKASVDGIPIAQQTYRLKSLDRMHQEAATQGNKALAAQLLEQAAKEVGGAYTNARRLQGDPSAPLVLEHRHAMTDEDLERIAAGDKSGQ